MRLTSSYEAATFKDSQERSLLHWLGCWSHNKQDADAIWRAECVRISLAACSSEDERQSLLTSTDAAGEVPLQVAVRCGAIAVAHALLQAMGDEVLDEAQVAQLSELAKSSGSDELAEMLTDVAGAKASSDAARCYLPLRPDESTLPVRTHKHR